MKIAQVAPLYESVPPPGYGGTERVVFWLAEELVRRGHQVTLFASGDSQCSARLVAASPRALRTDPDARDFLAHHLAMLETVRKHAGEFDIIHFHTDYLHFPMLRHCRFSHITTLHGRLDMPDLVPLYRQFGDVPVISISYEQRRPLSWINWVGNVYHGLPENLLAFHPKPGKYLAFIGRISPEKRPDRAIQIATATGMPLKIAAKVDPADQKYFEMTIKPLLNNPLVEFIGEIGDDRKAGFLGNACACLAPIDWPEPFGLNMIEAMACGTPVIAFRHGSVPELIEDGVNGFIVGSVEEAVSAVRRVPQLARAACRDTFERRFTARRMGSDYLRIYQKQMEASPAYFRKPVLAEREVAEIDLVTEDLG